MRRFDRGWGNPEIGIAEDIHEVSVGDIASKVADDDAVPDGVVDRAGFLSDGAVRTGKKNWVGRGSSIRNKLVCGRLEGRLLD